MRTGFCAILLLLSSLALGQAGSAGISDKFQGNYDFAWAGGLNACQFGKIDIDLDGIDDLVVFDRVGDRLLPFVAVTGNNGPDYRYAPEYERNFPDLVHWAIFADYDRDGKTDIFTYSPPYAGMKVFRNTSGTELEFSLAVFPYLTSFQGGGYVNILVTYADYPAITDIDDDGDLDILTFWGLGSFVEKHQNMSMEKYGHSDSLDFVKTDYCWGYFAESEESNEIFLDTCLRCLNVIPGIARDRHTGSTFCVTDLNGDQLPDLLLGDVDYPNLVALYNGGNSDTARMTSYDWQYPPSSPVDLFTMPVAFYNDIDFDGIAELLVSPFDPNPFQAENFQSIWFYDNYGTNDEPVFGLNSTSFIQDRMLDFGAGAYPVFTDINADGLMDIIAGNYGYYDSSYYDQYGLLHTVQTGKLAYLRNIGSASQPAFILEERDFAGISGWKLKGIVPAFGDLDNDGDTDMLTGNETGSLIAYRNNAGAGNIAEFELWENNNPVSDINVGDYSAPQLFDLDNDGKSDLIIGERAGNLNYYRNTGTLNDPVFTYITDSLGKINVTDYSVSLDGFSTPCFFRGNDDITRLVVGSESGELHYFTNIDGNLAGAFEPTSGLSSLLDIQPFDTDRGYRTSAAIIDLDNDGYPEMIAGNFSGGLEYFSRNGQSPVSGIHHESDATFQVNVFPNPSSGKFRIWVESGFPDLTSEVNLFDITGKPLFSSKFVSARDISIQVPDLQPGLYILRIKFMSDPTRFYYHSEKIIVY
ncbi:MAG TPA: FG-GAP-like repeat-containing protein [Bacteroidales bacterium]|nr:FG-GAP-like repeat-containing protein [Bacteroidales bacterium]HPI86441.1 FG-GAP-like repeat-containing protein [Bacteroidales bacterium]HPM93677.1 FG-GAP-like repeat-containing protein [Bacteroidales bacterium]